MKGSPRATWAFMIGALALALAILPTFVLPMTHPDPPLQSRMGQTVTEIGDRLSAFVQQREYTAPVTPAGERARWSRYASLAAAISGLLSIIFAAWAYGHGEAQRACAAAMGLGIAALACSNLIGVATGLLALLYRINPLIG